MAVNTKCRRCSECEGARHHALPNGDFGNDDAPEELRDFDFCCKHCETLGKECPECYSEGTDLLGNPCGTCDGEGVIWQE